ncbi:MAG TPA: hypothetical protein VHL11_21720, partial [Phototrophicaceae bacterium]|nr:hypothetical protein [Phototrophicaceae bacterium]
MTAIPTPSTRINSINTRLADLTAFVTVIAAAVIRLIDVGGIPHYIDNAYPIWQALLIADRGIFPVIGQMSSAGIPNPPLTAYLYLPIVALTRSPLAVYVVVIVLNALAVGFGYLLGKRLFNPGAGLLVAVLMAVNPWLIEYSRFTWV